MASVSKNVSEDAAANFALLIAGMSQFIVTSSENPAFAKAGITLSEWVALSVLSQTPGLSSAQLAAQIGVRGTRINRIADALLKRGLISSNPSQDEPRRKLLSATPAGMAQAKSLNVEIQQLISRAFGDREHLLAGMITRTQQLMRIAVLMKADHETPGTPAGRLPKVNEVRLVEPKPK